MSMIRKEPDIVIKEINERIDDLESNVDFTVMLNLKMIKMKKWLKYQK